MSAVRAGGVASHFAVMDIANLQHCTNKKVIVANAGKMHFSLYERKVMQNEYKPTLCFNAAETRRIDAAAEGAGLKSSAWIRKIILDNAPQLSIKDPLAVRVAEFNEPLGWNLIHFTEAMAFAEAIFGSSKRRASSALTATGRRSRMSTMHPTEIKFIGSAPGAV